MGKNNEADIISAELSVRDTIKCKQEWGTKFVGWALAKASTRARVG